MPVEPRGLNPSTDGPRLARIQKDTLRDQTYRELRLALISGRFEPGEQITIKSLVDELGVGVMPVRESVQRLVAEGALLNLPSGRVRVPLISENEFKSIYEIRILLEGLAVEKATQLATRQDIARLKDMAKTLNQSIASSDPEHILRENIAYHFEIYRLSGDPFLVQVIENIWLRFGSMLILPVKSAAPEPGLFEQFRKRHLELVAAIGTGDPAAANAILKSILQESATWYRRNVFHSKD